ncbi:MAG: glycosyltransferase [Azoarcus sp.]|jgi:glycosyltransferase involved in cell wall biosynthesis|nr:glycosyltransferase [Azoarcus sp.]
MAEISKGPHIGVLSSHFPNSAYPAIGLSVRERMFRVARRLPLFVVSPTPYIPLVDSFRRGMEGELPSKPIVPEYEEQQGIPVWFPPYATVPGPQILRLIDGWSMSLGAYPRFAALRRAGRLDLIDAHGAYPDGYAGVLLGRKLGVPVTITLHGSELVCARDPQRVKKLREAFSGAARVFAVCDALRQFAIELGVTDDRVEVIGNGIDAELFHPHDRTAERAALDISPFVPVMVSVGHLSEEKGHQRVIDALPSLTEQWPGLVYLIIDSGNPARKGYSELEKQIARMKLEPSVRFFYGVTPQKLSALLSAADIFVHVARLEGPVNVLLEAMACGLPVLATDAGVNREVVCRPELGELIPHGEQRTLEAALKRILSATWDRTAIRRYAETHHWDARVDRLCRAFAETRDRASAARSL